MGEAVSKPDADKWRANAGPVFGLDDTPMETLPFPRRGPASGWLRGEALYLSIEPGQANLATTDDPPEQLIELFSVARLAFPDHEHAPPK